MHYISCNYNLLLLYPHSDFHSYQVKTCVFTTAPCSAPSSATPASIR